MDSWGVGFYAVTLLSEVLPLAFFYGLVVSIFISYQFTLLSGLIFLTIYSFISYFSKGFDAMYQGDIFINSIFVIIIGSLVLSFGMILHGFIYSLTHKGKFRSLNANPKVFTLLPDDKSKK